MRKLAYAIKFDPMERYRKLEKICSTFGGKFEKDGKWFERRRKDLEAKFNKLQGGISKVGFLGKNKKIL